MTKKGKSQNVYLGQELMEQVKAIAEANDRSVSYVVTKALEKLLEEIKGETPKEVSGE